LLAGPQASTAADYIAIGFTPDAAMSMAATPPPPFEVWSCNWETFLLFHAMSTQWRIGFGGPTGLDYSQLPVVAQLLEIPLDKERFDGIRVMERETLMVLAERNEK